MKIVLVNGAPGAGKSEVFKIMTERRKDDSQIVEEMKFAQPLDDIARAILPPMTDEAFRELREPMKDQPLPGFDGLTMRQLLIGISENLIKPLFGNDYFGKVAAGRVLSRIDKITEDEWQYPTNVIVFTDSGFQVECDAFCKIMNHHHVPVELIRISRPGKTFDDDSREYVHKPRMHIVFNNKGIPEFKKAVYTTMDRIGI